MGLNNIELMKLFDFILEHKNIIINEIGLFSRDTLIKIRKIVNGKIANDFVLTNAQQQLIIDTFLESNDNFNDNTPNIVLNNALCIKKAIKKNIRNVYFIKQVPKEIEPYVVEQIIEKQLQLNEHSPLFMKQNYEIALNSINLNPFTANYVDWDIMKKEQITSLVDKAMANGYMLSSFSNPFLAKRKEVALGSIKRDINNVQYMNEKLKDDPDILKYLLLYNYSFPKDDLLEKDLSYLQDSDLMMQIFKQLDVYKGYSASFIERFNKLFLDAINSKPTIQAFDAVFQMVAENKWADYKRLNLSKCFRTICALLKVSKTLSEAKKNINFLETMKEYLNEKYDLLCQAMEEYFTIYHGNMKNKLEKIEQPQTTIAKLTSLYVAKRKEQYKKRILNNFYDWLKPFYKLRMDQPAVYKKIIWPQKKKIFKHLFDEKNKEILDFLDNISEKYGNKDMIEKMMSNFDQLQVFSLDYYIPEPSHYKDYKRYEKVMKLIHRLNSGYITYNGIELRKYHDIISYDQEKHSYYYSGYQFDNATSQECINYKNKIKLFNKMKKEIMDKINTIEIKEPIEIRDDLKESFPFTDCYFVFDSKNNLQKICVDDLLNQFMNQDNKIAPFDSDDVFRSCYHLLVDEGIIWLLLLKHYSINKLLEGEDLDSCNIVSLINEMDSILDLSKKFQITTSNFTNLFFIKQLSCNFDTGSLSLLGSEVITTMSEKYTNEDLEDAFSIAEVLIAKMAGKANSTVPYVKGEKMGYQYSLYDSQDETVLLSGINTDSCFKINDAANDLLHYCALDKNGFVLKITDSFGNFMAKCSGFRSGNCVFMNQLRTIYDVSGNFYIGNNSSRQGIISAFQSACKDIIDISQSNPKEESKIDFVFVTKSYALQDCPSNVLIDVTKKIGECPINQNSNDWHNFVDSNGPYLEDIADYQDHLYVDYGNYPLICMASFKDIKEIKPDDLIFDDVEAVYERKRNKIEANALPDANTFCKVNKIEKIYSLFSKTDYEPIEVSPASLVLTGDNWYLVYENDSIINARVLDFDEKAKEEFKTAKKVLLDQVEKSKHELNLQTVQNELILQDTNPPVKVLKK